MKLIIAEKPSLARNIVAGIGPMNKRGSYFEGCGYLVTWAFGHLFSLCDIEDYEEGEQGNKTIEKKRWSMDNLPCFPSSFSFRLRTEADGRVDDGVRRQFETIKTLCARPDVDAIVNAGDADREGEIIVRLCVENALRQWFKTPKAPLPELLQSSQKKFLRLWLPDQTPETVAKALSEMKDETAYENLANEGFSRTYIDWLYGVNLTRYATLKTGVLLRVGRVIVPIVKAIYDRDMAIRNFVPDVYYAPTSREHTNGEEIELQSKNRFDKDKLADAQAMCALYNATGAVVTDKKSKKDTLSPGKLYSLSKLQSVLGKKYKMSMDESLKIVQKLYEEGYLTYPRTNSEYLATAEKDKVKKILDTIAGIGYPVTFKDKKTIFDDSKIESHSALTPTYKIPKKEALSDAEMKVYQTVFRRFVAVFCAQECVAQKSEITIAVGNLETFVLKGTVILEKGWTKYDDAAAKDKILPDLKVGDTVAIDFKPLEKETTPPKHYTIETLNNYLKNPFREEKAAADAKKAADSDTAEGEDDTEDYKAVFEGLELGTEATRTGIIDNAKKSRYIALNKDVYTILPDGIYLIESLEMMNISMDKYKTSTLGQALKKVFHGLMTVSESVALAQEEIREVFASSSEPEKSRDDTGFYGDLVGKCPACGGDVIKGRYGYGCREYKAGCKFQIHSRICQKVIPIAEARLLLSQGTTSKLEGFVSKRTGKTFGGRLKLQGTEIVFDFSD